MHNVEGRSLDWTTSLTRPCYFDYCVQTIEIIRSLSRHQSGNCVFPADFRLLLPTW